METELQELVDYVIGRSGIAKLQIKSVNRGRAMYSTNHITIPQWVLKKDIAVVYYYAIHEACHILTKSGHDNRFKQLEQKYCKEFGIDIEYMKAYPKKTVL